MKKGGSKGSSKSGLSGEKISAAGAVPGAIIDDYSTTTTEQTFDNSLSSIEADVHSLSSASASSRKRKKKKSSSKDRDKDKHHHHSHEKEKHHHHRHPHQSHQHHHHASEGHDKEGRADYHWEKHDSSRRLGLPKKTSSSSSSKSGRSKRRPSSSSSASSATNKSVEKRLEKLELGDDADKDDFAAFTDTATGSAELLQEVNSTKPVRERVAVPVPDTKKNALLTNTNFDDEVYGLDEEELDMEEDEALNMSTTPTSSTLSPMIRRSSKSSAMSPMARPVSASAGNPNNRSLSPPVSTLRQSLRDSFSRGGSINNASSSFIPPFLVDNDDDEEEEEDDDEGIIKAGDGIVNHPSSAYRRVSSAGGNASTSSIGSSKNNTATSTGGIKGGHNSADLAGAIDDLDLVPEAMGLDEGIPEGW